MQPFKASPGLLSLLQRIRKLPSPPKTYVALNEYMNNPNASIAGAAKIIERDVAMTTELLKLTNRPDFALPARMSSPMQVIRVMGFDVLSSLVLQLGVFQSFVGPPAEQKLMEAISIDAYKVASIARRIAVAEDLPRSEIEDCFCAGMLCSIGALVLLDYLPDGFAAIRKAIAEGEDPVDAEMAEFGANQFQVGAFLLEKWGFKPSIVDAVAYVGKPGDGPQATRLDVNLVVHLARVMAGPFPGFTHMNGDDDGIGRLALDMESIERIKRQDSLARWMILAAEKG